MAREVHSIDPCQRLEHLNLADLQYPGFRIWMQLRDGPHVQRGQGIQSGGDLDLWRRLNVLFLRP